MSHGHSTRGEIRRLRELSRKWHSTITNKQYSSALFTKHEANLEQDVFLANFQIVRRVPDCFIFKALPGSPQERDPTSVPSLKCGKENKKPRRLPARNAQTSTSSDSSSVEYRVRSLKNKNRRKDKNPFSGPPCKKPLKNRTNRTHIPQKPLLKSTKVSSCVHRLSKIQPIISSFHRSVTFSDACEITFNGVTISCAVCRCTSRREMLPSRKVEPENMVSANVDLGYKSDDGIIDLTMDDSS